MTESIPITDAIRAVKLAIEAWNTDSAPKRSDESSTEALARAGFSSSLVFLAGYLKWTTVLSSEGEKAVAPLVAHWDAVKPGWREETR